MRQYLRNNQIILKCFIPMKIIIIIIMIKYKVLVHLNYMNFKKVNKLAI